MAEQRRLLVGDRRRLAVEQRAQPAQRDAVYGDDLDDAAQHRRSITQNPADQVKDDVEILGGVGRGNSYFDPFAFALVSEARLGNAGFNSLRGPGRTQWDMGLFRQINLGGQRTCSSESRRST